MNISEVVRQGLCTQCGACVANFCPFPPSIANFLSKLFPTFSEALFFLVRRQNKKVNFIQVLDTRFHETPYFKGR